MRNDMKIKIVSTMLLGTMVMYAIPVYANTKDEVVYSKIDNNGKVYSKIVSDTLSNDGNKEFINDISNLLNIENTGGDQTFTKDGNKIVWKAQGDKIIYKGDSEKELPVTCEIKYELDGKEVTPEEIVGKTGEVKVTLKYTNNDSHIVNVNGKNVKLYTPFVVVAGTLIDSTKNENIEVTRGKVIDNGTKTIAIGMAMPGLQESLDLAKSKADIPSSITFKMDAKDFEMNDIFSYATAKIVEDADLKMLDDLDEIYDKANELKDASVQLVDGTKELHDGTSKLDEATTEFKKGTSDAYNGASLITETVKSSTIKMKNDHSSALKEDQVNAIAMMAANGATATVRETIQNGTLKQMTDAGIEQKATEIYNSSIASAKQIATETALKTAKETMMQTVDMLAPQVAEGAAVEAATATTVKILTKVNAQVEASRAQITEIATAKALQDTVTKLTAKYTAAGVTKTPQEIMAEAKAMISSPEGQAKIKAIVDQEINSKKQNIEAAKRLAAQEAKANVEANKASIITTTKTKLNAYLNATNPSTHTTNQAALNAQIKAKAEAGIDAQSATIKRAALESAKQIANGVAEVTALSTAEKTAKEVASNVATNVADNVKKEAMNKIVANMTELSNGLEQLQDGLYKLEDGASQLHDGTNKLNDGASQLEEGMSKFNEEGIEKVVSYINNDLRDLDGRMKALEKLANDYNTFTGLEEGDEGDVKFITIIDALKIKDNEDKNKNVNNQNQNQSNKDQKNENDLGNTSDAKSTSKNK